MALLGRLRLRLADMHVALKVLMQRRSSVLRELQLVASTNGGRDPPTGTIGISVCACLGSLPWTPSTYQPIDSSLSSETVYQTVLDRVNELSYIAPITELPTLWVHTKDVRVEPNPVNTLDARLGDFFWVE